MTDAGRQGRAPFPGEAGHNRAPHMTDWMTVRSGSTGSSTKVHAVVPDADTNEEGAPALCGQWLRDVTELMWDPRATNACLVCREKYRQLRTTHSW